MSQFLSVGIDHGTSNSAIAVLDDGEIRVISPSPTELVMPSAVFITKKGRMFVGAAARQAILTLPPEEGQGHVRYKRRIGQDDRYDFRLAQQVKTAPQLGAIVIRELLKLYASEGGGEVNGAVITIPAVFDQSACDGTREAARGAGLEHTPLLMEPVAAALAYSFTSDAKRARWMVFDLGGGTLDVSFVQLRDGKPDVPENGHVGDTHLGGSNFDRELMTPVLRALQDQYALKGFSETNPAYSTAWGKLLLAIEEAKIRLSKDTATHVEVDDLCHDEEGRMVDVRVPVTRAELERLIAKDVTRAVQFCHMLLKNNDMKPSDVDRLILVGGPTKTPYIKQILKDALGIPLEDRIDPMTAVAQGAALQAATERLPDHLARRVPLDREGLELTLEYEANSRVPTYSLVGRVALGDRSHEGITVEITRTDGGWTSGTLPVGPRGVFQADLMLMDVGRPTQSRFRTVVRDDTGRILADRSAPDIWYPFPESGARQPTTVSVGLKDNSTGTLIEAGTSLPFDSKVFPAVTSAPLRRGNPDDVLVIPIVEAVVNLFGNEDTHADCQVTVGAIRITALDERVTRDVPEGTDVEIQLAVDASREFTARVYVPLLREEFSETWKKQEYGIELDTIVARFEDCERTLAEIDAVQQTHPVSAVADCLAIFAKLDAIATLRTEVDRAKAGERDAFIRAYRRTLELAGSLNHIRTLQQEARLQHLIARLRSRAADEELHELGALERELEESAGASDALTRVDAGVERVRVHVERRPFWSMVWDHKAFAHHFGPNGKGGFTVEGTPDQLAALNEMSALLEEMIDVDNAGGVFTDRQLEHSRDVRERLYRAWPDLQKWRAAIPDPKLEKEEGGVLLGGKVA